MPTTLKNFIFSINVILITLLFVIVFVFTTYLHTSLAKKEATKHANAVSKQVFASMYQVMKKGWSHEELTAFSSSLKDNFNDTSYSIDIYRGRKVVELFGVTHVPPKDSEIEDVFKSGLQNQYVHNNKLRNLQPINAKQECLKCHVNASIGDTLGVIDIKQDIIDIIDETFWEYVVFFLIIIPIFVIAAYIASRYTINKINVPLTNFNRQIEQINSMDDFKDFNPKETDLNFQELNLIIANVNQLTLKLKEIAVDKDLLEFEVELLDKFIITSDVVKDWKEFVSELLHDINKIMETFTLMTMFRVGDDQFELDIFWHGVPEDGIKVELENFIINAIHSNDKFEDSSDIIIVHTIVEHNHCIPNILIKEIEHQTKTLFLDTPKIGGIVGISVHSEIIKDPVRGIVIDSILTTMANLVGSVKAINKYTKDLEYYAAHDPLTNLFNQRVFSDMMEYEIKRAKRHEYPFGLMVIDCDNFKAINDRYGHAFGDEFLQVFADLLVKTKRDEDILSRYGGDEFTIILPECDLNGAVAIARRIAQAVEKQTLVTPDGALIGITVSIGLAIYPEHSDNQKELFVIADSMMYRVKQEGKNGVAVPNSDDILSIVKEQKEKSAVLLQAVVNNHIVPFFQPIVPTGDSDIVIHELLMRIQVGDRLMSAYEFIETAEQMSLISKMDLMVIKNAFMKIEAENYKGYLFINLSPKSLIVSDFVKNIITMVHEYNIDKSNIVFEITERETVKNFSVLEKFVQNLKLEGFKFAIDDFGSGFSSFHYIKKFPIDFLKIDGEFILNINKDEKDRAFVQSIVTLAQMLKVKTIAEFVEDETIVTTLQEMGVDFMQGFHLGKPSKSFMKHD